MRQTSPDRFRWFVLESFGQLGKVFSSLQHPDMSFGMPNVHNMYVFACFCHSVAVFLKWALFILYTLSCSDGRIGTFYKFIGFMSDWYMSRAMFMSCPCPELSKKNCTTSHIWWASWYSWYFELIHLHELADFMNLWTGRAIHAQTCHYENGSYIPRTQKTWKGSKQQFHYHYTFVTHSSQTYSHDQQVDVHTVHKQQTKQIVKRCINMHLRSHMWRLNVS